MVYANNGIDAIALAQEHLPDLVILDMIMPEVGGSEVASALREIPVTKDIPFLIVSGAILSKKDELNNNNMSEHNQYVLAKPITPSEIIELVRKIFSISPPIK